MSTATVRARSSTKGLRRLPYRDRPLTSTKIVTTSSAAQRILSGRPPLVAEVERLRHQQRSDVPGQGADGGQSAGLHVDQSRFDSRPVSGVAPRMSAA